MPTIKRLPEFMEWIDSLRDDRAAARIAIRIDRVALGNPGSVSSVGEGVSEMKIDYGPGYRVYFKRRGEDIVILICGGDKSTQEKDIKRAKFLAIDI